MRWFIRYLKIGSYGLMIGVDWLNTKEFKTRKHDQRVSGMIKRNKW